MDRLLLQASIVVAVRGWSALGGAAAAAGARARRTACGRARAHTLLGMGDATDLCDG